MGFGGKGVLAPEKYAVHPFMQTGTAKNGEVSGRVKQSRKVSGRTGKNLPMSPSPRLVLTAQELLQPLIFSEARERYCEYNVHRSLVFSCHPCVWYTYPAMVWCLIFPRSDGGERRWRGEGGRKRTLQHVLHAAT